MENQFARGIKKSQQAVKSGTMIVREAMTYSSRQPYSATYSAEEVNELAGKYLKYLYTGRKSKIK